MLNAPEDTCALSSTGPVLDCTTRAIVPEKEEVWASKMKVPSRSGCDINTQIGPRTVIGMILGGPTDPGSLLKQSSSRTGPLSSAFLVRSAKPLTCGLRFHHVMRG